MSGGITLLLAVGAVSAQTDTLVSLPVITIRDAPAAQTGYAVWTADSLPESGMVSLANRLLWDAAVAVRANAPGTLATVSVRGAGPSRTAVIWQGLNLQSPMNGVVDAALLPLWPGDALSVQYGGQSAALSTGAMGGAVRIIPALWRDSAGWSARAGMDAGSFGFRNGHAALTCNAPATKMAVRIAAYRAENDFPFRNTALIGAPATTQRNNFAEKLDLQQFNRFETGANHTLETAIWYQRAFREIPPSMTEAPAQSWQRDRAFRAVATWTNHAGKKAYWQHRLAWMDEYLDFFRSGTSDVSRSRTALLSTSFQTDAGKGLRLRGDLNGTYIQAQVDGYADSTEWYGQGRLAAFLAAEYHWRKWQFQFQARPEWVADQGMPFTWSFGAQKSWRDKTVLRMHLSRNFNLPTLNDRFWRALGDPDLNPETGYSGDAGISWAWGNFSTTATAYQMLLDDWILWQPGSDGLFRPGNLRQVWSRGIDLSTGWTYSGPGGSWQVKGRYQWVRATSTKVYGGSTAALNKQLPYTPRHSGGVSLLWKKGPWSAAYLHQWTGSRYTTSDNTASVAGFQTGNAFLAFTPGWGQHRISFRASLENCWNVAYQIIAYRPMPGRSWRLGFQWEVL